MEILLALQLMIAAVKIVLPLTLITLTWAAWLPAVHLTDKQIKSIQHK